MTEGVKFDQYTSMCWLQAKSRNGRSSLTHETRHGDELRISSKRGTKPVPAIDGKIAVVAGATRGAGRGIACALGEAGATVYCTGRSVRGKPATGNRPETIEETAEMVTARGGTGIFCAG